jgi:hypothetical protein
VVPLLLFAPAFQQQRGAVAVVHARCSSSVVPLLLFMRVPAAAWCRCCS